jgi:DNA-binding NtrC family response regulator
MFHALQTEQHVARTILVVEDEVLIRMAISQYLRDCGFKVIEAANADEAMLVLQRPDLTIDVVLSDVEMPGSMDGVALANWIKKNKDNLDVIIVSGPAPAAVAAAYLCDTGATLTKPYEPEALLAAINKLLAERGLQI